MPNCYVCNRFKNIKDITETCCGQVCVVCYDSQVYKQCHCEHNKTVSCYNCDTLYCHFCTKEQCCHYLCKNCSDIPIVCKCFCKTCNTKTTDEYPQNCVTCKTYVCRNCEEFGLDVQDGYDFGIMCFGCIEIHYKNTSKKLTG